MKLPGFCGPTYTVRSISASADRAINLYPELMESPAAKNRFILIGTPGLRKHVQLATGMVRGLCEFRGRVLAVSDKYLYEITAEGTSTLLGEVAQSSLPATFADNGVEICIVSGNRGYILDGNTLTPIPTDQLEAISIVTYLDGYFIGLVPDSRRVRISNLYDGMVWDELDTKVKESAPDNVVSILADHGELWVFGDRFSEVWYNSGNADFPLDRIPNARLELGCGAPWSVAKLDNSIFWLGNDERGNRVVWRATGYSAQRVSNHSVEHHLNRFGGIADAVAWTYQEEGHSFYCIQFPSEPPNSEATWVYDASTGMWHERAYWDKIRGQWQTHRARCHCAAFNEHLVGDRTNGKVYRQRLDYYDDDGDRIRRIRIAPHLCEEMKEVCYSRFQLDCEIAVGLGVIDTSVYGPDMYGLEYVQR